MEKEIKMPETPFLGVLRLLVRLGVFAEEIAVSDTYVYRDMSKHGMSGKDNIPEKFKLDGDNYIYILAEGRLINLSAAEGHPSDVMSMSFCGQALACEYLVKNKGTLENKLIQLPEEIDDAIAQLQLDTMNVKIDELTEEQIEYLNSWQEGTA